MAADAYEACNSLLAFVLENNGRGLSPNGSEYRHLQDLEAAAFAQCSIAGIRTPDGLPHRNLRPFGLMRIPSWRDSEGLNLVATDDWQQVMRGIVALAEQLRGKQKGKADSGSETPSVPTKSKRSTERGEARAKLIAALTAHHKYSNGSCMNLEPIGSNELAQLAEVAPSTASAFFKKEFNGRLKYRARCADAPRLVKALKLLNDEYSADDLFGSKPPSEREREDED